jgi:hypothetical protein
MAATNMLNAYPTSFMHPINFSQGQPGKKSAPIFAAAAAVWTIDTRQTLGQRAMLIPSEQMCNADGTENCFYSYNFICGAIYQI